MPKDTAILRVDPEGIGPAARLVSIFDPASVGEALAENGWTNSEAIEVLTEIARDRANATSRERMAAVKMLEDKAEKSLTLAGIIQRISLEALQDEGGTKKKLTAEGLQLIKSNTARTLSTLELLEAGSQTPELIDVDTEESHDARPGSDVSAPQYSSSGYTGPTGTFGGPGSGVDGSKCSKRGPCTDGAVHGLERTNPPCPTGQGQDNDQTTVQGAGDERSSRTPIQPGRGQPSNGPRAEDRQRGREAECNHSSCQSTRNVGNATGLERPTYTDSGTSVPKNIRQRSTTPYTDPGTTKQPILQPTRPSRRTTPYTPGEARRRATRSAAQLDSGRDDSSSREPSSSMSTPRPADGSTDTKSKAPSIAARYLPPELAARGFPGDSTPDP